MTSIQLLKEQTKYLRSILDQVKSKEDLKSKLEVLENEDETKVFLAKNHPIAQLYPELSELEKVAISSIAVIGQADNVFHTPNHLSDTASRFKTLLKNLILFEQFYLEIGGIIGYHLKVIQLLCESQNNSEALKAKKIHRAEGVCLHEDIEKCEKAVIEGIKALPQMGEIYPIGGAGDRLNLSDEKTGLPLPTAKLNYLGQSLLTGMIKDLQAREFIYFKIFDKQLTTPIAMMTSETKNNHHFIEKICESNNWFYRPKESYILFKQPLAPVLTTDGQWALSDHLKLFLKPSGHGVIWKLAKDLKVLDWFKNQNRPKALVRQMNNPTAGTDNGIFALIGIGCSENKSFGFASCQRLIQAAEGVNVLIEEEIDGKYHYAISNVEYTEFDKYDLKDISNSLNNPYSIFPSNTNILFVDFHEVEKALQRCTIPGMLINMKADVSYIDPDGNKKIVKGGRLESTMQNIADFMSDHFDEPQNIEEQLNLKTFLTYNVRRKTISVAKKIYQEGGSINETPEGCYYNLLQNNSELLTKYCSINLPPLPSIKEFLKEGPSIHFLFHPALGPLYSIIKQKLQKGNIERGSELILDLSELEVYNLNLAGSLLIYTNSPMGHINSENLLKYSNLSGKCTLINVSVQNQGINFKKKNVFWKNHIERKEKCQIYLEENSEFFAQNVTLNGEYNIHVPKNTRMVASTDSSGKTVFESSPIEKPTWSWKYEINNANQVQLTKQFHRKK